MCKHKKDKIYHTCHGLFDNDIVYCVYCIWEKFSKRPVVTIELDKLPCISSIDWNGELCTNQKLHEDPILNCNMNYPIFVTDEPNGYEIADSCHRIHKAYRTMQTTMRCIILSADDINECIYDD